MDLLYCNVLRTKYDNIGTEYNIFIRRIGDKGKTKSNSVHNTESAAKPVATTQYNHYTNIRFAAIVDNNESISINVSLKR